MTTVEDAFAAWRLEHPSEHGWPLDAFKAGWEAAAALNEAQRAVLERFAARMDSWEANHPQRGPYALRDSHQICHRLGDFRDARRVARG